MIKGKNNENERIKKSKIWYSYWKRSYFGLCLVYFFVYCYLLYQVERPAPESEPKHSCPDEPKNLYVNGFQFDLYAYVTETESAPDSVQEHIWKETNLTYDITGSTREINTSLLISEVSFKNLTKIWSKFLKILKT